MVKTYIKKNLETTHHLVSIRLPIRTTFVQVLFVLPVTEKAPSRRRPSNKEPFWMCVFVEGGFLGGFESVGTFP